MQKESENLINALSHLEMSKESMLKNSKVYHLRQANVLANGEPIDADEIDLGLLSNKLSKMNRNSEELITELKFIVDNYDVFDENVLNILRKFREEIVEIKKRNNEVF